MSDPRAPQAARPRRRPARRPDSQAGSGAAAPAPAAQAQQAVQLSMDRRDNGGEAGQQAA